MTFSGTLKTASQLFVILYYLTATLFNLIQADVSSNRLHQTGRPTYRGLYVVRLSLITAL